jgi:hypothetical protein
MCYLIRCTIAYSSLRSFVSQSCAHFACFASSVRFATTVPFCCVFLFFLLSLLLMSDHLSSVLSRSCTSLSDVRKMHSWPLDFLYSWLSSSSAHFCTCASSSHYVGLTHHNRVQLFYRAWYMGRHPRSLHQLRWRSIPICGWSSFFNSLPCTSF